MGQSALLWAVSGRAGRRIATKKHERMRKALDLSEEMEYQDAAHSRSLICEMNGHTFQLNLIGSS
jgi:hypothetical protein